ncbi:MAG: DMT family transporter [Bacteroidota bacterium]|jgi:drug/metabolite transporter (DMT)-like permease
MNTRTKAELILFSTTFIWGSTFVVAKGVSEFVSPTFYIFLRFGIGAVLFLLFFFKELKGINSRTLKKGIILGGMLGTGVILQNIGIYQTTASKAAFITGLMVLFTPIAQFVLEKRPPNLFNGIGILIVTFGLYLLTSPEGSGINFGDILVLTAAMIFGIFIVYMDIFSKDENPFQLSFIQIASTSLVALIVLPFEPFHFSPESYLFYLLLVYMGFFATVVTTFSQTRFQKETTPTRAVIIFTVEPVIASILAYFFLQEIVGATGILGGILIIFGILLSEFSEGISKKFGLNFN